MTGHGYETTRTAVRPVVRGQRLVVSTGHYLASLAGMRMLESKGNAIDAGVAAVFAQLLLEFQSAGLGGECPILIYSAHDRRVVAINGNTRAPTAATAQVFRDRGFDLIPGDGFLSAGVCATAGALLTALERYGSLSLSEVLAPAIELASNGFPTYDALLEAIEGAQSRIRGEWASSARLLLPQGRLPRLGEALSNPDLASTYMKLVEAEHNARSAGRTAGIRAAMDRFYRGDIAHAIVDFQRDTTTLHYGAHKSAPPGSPAIASAGLLTYEDFARFETTVERSVTTEYRGLTVHKCGPWSQGPVMLQQLNLLEGFDVGAMRPRSADFIHTVVECAKLAFADREHYYGDPRFTRVPLEGLTSKAYARERRALIDPGRASAEQLPGHPLGFGTSQPAPRSPRASRPWTAGTTGTRAMDAAGNIFSATPSGGLLRSSPVVPGLGFALGTRLQQFWLDESHPDGLAPGKQPRTTLSPTVVTRDGVPFMGFGTPGGDQQDQWGLLFLVNVVDFGMDIQDAVDEVAFHSAHIPSSFNPRTAEPRALVVEADVEPTVCDELEARGHAVQIAPRMSLGNITAVHHNSVATCLEASATSRGQKAYAIGW